MVAYSNSTTASAYLTDPTRVPNNMDFVRRYGFVSGGGAAPAAGGGNTAYQQMLNPNYQPSVTGSATASGTSSTSSVLSSYQQAYDSARNANLSRYNEILAGYQNRYQRNMARLDGLGAQAKADIDTAFQGQSSQAGQEMVSRGLAGTTVAPTIQTGIERERVAAQTRLSEDLAREQIATDTGLSGDTLRFMENREDEYPDPSLYLKLLELEAATTPNAQGASLLPAASTYTPTPGQPFTVQNGLLYGGVATRSNLGGQRDRATYNGRTYEGKTVNGTYVSAAEQIAEAQAAAAKNRGIKREADSARRADIRKQASNAADQRQKDLLNWYKNYSQRLAEGRA